MRIRKVDQECLVWFLTQLLPFFDNSSIGLDFDKGSFVQFLGGVFAGIKDLKTRWVKV